MSLGEAMLLVPSGAIRVETGVDAGGLPFRTFDDLYCFAEGYRVVVVFISSEIRLIVDEELDTILSAVAARLEDS